MIPIEHSFFWLLFAHCIGDMVFQTQFIIQYKGKDWLAMISHIIIYTGCIAIALVYLNIFHWWKILFVMFGHLMIDRWKSRTPRDKAHWHYLYYDQSLHLIQLIIIFLV